MHRWLEVRICPMDSRREKGLARTALGCSRRIGSARAIWLSNRCGRALRDRNEAESTCERVSPYANDRAQAWMASAVRCGTQAGRDSVYRRCSRANLCQMRVYRGAKGQAASGSMSVLSHGNKRRQLSLYGHQQPSKSEKDGKRKKRSLKFSARFFYNRKRKRT